MNKSNLPKYEAKKIEIELFKEMYEKVKDTLTKKQIIEYLNKLKK